VEDRIDREIESGVAGPVSGHHWVE